MFFGHKNQEKRLAHFLKKYEKTAKSDPHRLLTLIPHDEYWRFFIDGIYQQSTREIREAFIKLHGEKLLKDKHFLSMTINQYFAKYNKRKELKALTNSKQLSIHELLQDKLNLDKRKYRKFSRLHLKNGNATINDILLIDQAWLAYEANEPHYLLSVYSAFFSHARTDHPLSVNFIRELHALLGAKVSGTNYEFTATHPGEFRNKPYVAFGLEPRNTTIQGLKEMFSRRKSVNQILIRLHDTSADTFCNISIDREFIANARNLIVSGFIRTTKNGDFDESTIDPVNKPLDAALLDIFTTISRTISTNEVANIVYRLVDGTFLFQDSSIKCYAYFANEVPEKNTQNYYQEELQSLIDKYQVDIETAFTPLAKLRVIVSFIQTCEQLHPFEDMNCRLFCMVILNYLLADNGFPYVIQADPNRFDLYSINELVDEMITGMAKTIELLNKKCVYGVDTKQFLAELKSSAALHSTFYVEFKAAMKLAADALNIPTPTQREARKHKH